MMVKLIHVSGKRKRAIARATLKEGKGTVRVNNLLLDHYQPKMARMKIMEPLLLAGEDVVSKVNISIDVKGGGMMSQTEASRLAVARALVQFDKKLKQPFESYDRHLLIADVRRKESAKPGRHGQARAKRQKSYR